MAFQAMDKNYVPPLKGRGSKLTPKMEMFVSEYMIDFVGERAILAAGYKTKNPARMAADILKHPLVSAEIEKRKEKRLVKNELTAEYLVQKLVSIIEATEEGNPQAALRGIELAGKTLGIFRDRQEISGPNGDAIKYEQETKKNADDFVSTIDRLARRADDEELAPKVVNIRD